MRSSEHICALVLRQPVAGALTQLLYAFHPSDARGQVWTKKTCISGFVGQTPYRCKVLIDSVSGQAQRFQVYAIADHDNAIEGDSRFRTGFKGGSNTAVWLSNLTGEGTHS